MSQNQQQDSWLAFFKDHQVRRYVRAQVKEASLGLHKSTSSCLYFSHQLKMESEGLEVNEISVLVGLGKAFPLQPPQIYFASSFTKPSLKDYRDILVDLIGQSWQPELKLVHILQKIPKFVLKLMDLKGKFTAMQKIGEYHANKYYDYSIAKELSLHNPFICFQTVQEKISIFVVSITSTHIIFFEPTNQPYFNEVNKLIIPKQQEITAMRIIFVAEIQALNQVTHDRNNKNQYNLYFTAFQLKKMEFLKQEWSKCLSITRSTRFMECLMKEIWHFGIQINVEVGKIKGNSEEDLLLSEASRLQHKLKHYFNRSTLIQLVNAYQKLVEYYSIQGPPYQQIYVSKTTFLYNRPDVQLILRAYSPT